jgi:tetratricopeptide (TPR) repeat protein
MAELRGGFTNREDAERLVTQLCHRQGGMRAVVFWGVSGAGKTRLLDQIRTTWAPELGYRSELLDLETLIAYEVVGRTPNDPSLARQILDSLARFIERWSATTLTAYRAAVEETEASLRQAYSQQPEIHAGVSARWLGRVNQTSIKIVTDSGRDQAAVIRALYRSQLVGALSRAVRVASERADALSQCLVCIDTTERLHFLDDVAQSDMGTGMETIGVRHWLTAQVLPELAAAAPGMQFVLAGREDLQLPAELSAAHLELVGWQARHTREYLVSCGFEEDEAIFSLVQRLTEGHPLWVNVLAEACLSAREQGHPLDPGDISAIARSEPEDRWVVRVLLSRLSPSQRRVVTVAALPRHIEKERLSVLLQEDPDAQPLPADWFDRLCEHSFVSLEPATSRRRLRRMHPLMRIALLAYLRDDESSRLRALHLRAAERFTATDMLEAIYHRFAAGDYTLFEEWQQRLAAHLGRFELDSALQLVETVVAAEQIAAFAGRSDILLAGYRSAARIAFWQVRLDEAREYLNSALDLAVGDPLMEAELLLELGEVLHDLLDLGAGMSAARRALAIYAEHDDQLGQANALRLIADIQYAYMDVRGAMSALDSALRHYRAAGSAHGEATALHLMSHIHLGQADLDGAFAHVRSSLSRYREAGDLRGEAGATALLADILLNQGRITDAAAAIDHAVRLYSGIGVHGTALILLGRIRLVHGELTGAHAAAEEARVLFEKLGNQLHLANALLIIGHVGLEAGDPEPARTTAGQTLEMYRQIGNPLGEAHALRLLGSVALAQRDNDRATSLTEEAMDLYGKIGNPLGQADALLQLARVAAGRGDLVSARELALEAEHRYEQAGGRLKAAHARQQLALVRLLSGELEDGRAELTLARDGYRELDDRIGVAAIEALLRDVAGRHALDDPLEAAIRAQLEVDRYLA